MFVMPQHQATSTDTRRSSPPRRAGSLRTLVVDSSAEFLEQLCAFLEGHGLFRVVATAQEVHDALHKAVTWRPELVLIAVPMPLMGGLEATPHLLRQVPGVRVILMSAFDVPAIRKAAQEKGAHGFILKARIGHDLVDMVRALFGLHAGEAVA